jgi:CheY-like chemotaxis protein
MDRLRLLIVDDEPLIRAGIRGDLSGVESVQVAGECGTVAEAVATIRSDQFDLVLLAVQMPDGTGYVIREVGPQRTPTVVFVTAYDTYALRAFEVNAVDYLLKPFNDARLKESIDRVRARLSQPAQPTHQVEKLIEAHSRLLAEKGLSVPSSYTFSRNIDTTQASTFFSDATNGTTNAFPKFAGFNYNKGLADYHAKHTWVMNGSWEIPFGRDLSGRVGWLARGWQISAITQARIGNPLTVFVSANRSRSQWSPSIAPVGLGRVSMAPGYTHQSAVLGGPDRYFDPAAFLLQPAGTLGNLGRGALIGHNLRLVDLSFAKNNRVAETMNVQFRAEAFNLLNWPNFGPPNLLAYNGAQETEQPLTSLGRARSTVTATRQIQFGLRMSF